jgi:hypothetical protein
LTRLDYTLNSGECPPEKGSLKAKAAEGFGILRRLSIYLEQAEIERDLYLVFTNVDAAG